MIEMPPTRKSAAQLKITWAINSTLNVSFSLVADLPVPSGGIVENVAMIPTP